MDACSPKLNQALTATVVALINAKKAAITWLSAYNPSNALAYIQIFDAAAAGDVTLGTTVPKLSLPVKTLDALSLDLDPTAFYLGIQIAATTTPNGLTAPSAALVANFGIRGEPSI